jgi:4-alpha-glucanotransferase
MSLYTRASGVLLHPTSLPARYGIGDFGDAAYRFVDYLQETLQSLWQVLPLGPTSYGDSPYQALSTFAGNTNLISLDILVGEGYLTQADVSTVPSFPASHVDYGPVIEYHNRMLALAYTRFKAKATPAEFGAWCAQNAEWLDDYALFIALKNAHGGKPWVEWETPLALYEAEAIAAARQQYADEVNAQKFYQWLFAKQWDALKSYAHARGIRVVGDVPIFVAHDSSDVWTNKELFYLDKTGRPTVIAGVPPDYFSPTGQRWGNPLYNWKANKKGGYAWWIKRVKAALAQTDYVRIDHFRGFAEYWEVPASEETAVNGKWVEGPRADLFKAIEKALGPNLPIIAEDLGLITQSVIDLRDAFNLPGMKIIQFAFGGDCGQDPFLPHNYIINCVAYTGTHDNNTTNGWYHHEATQDQRQCFENYVGSRINQANWEMIRLGMKSVAHTFIMPMQDILGYGAETRMNTPGAPSGNWSWRTTLDAIHGESKGALKYLTHLYSRAPKRKA